MKPPMRIVYKGWFVTAERHASIETLRRFDSRTFRKGRAWWKWLNARWKRT